MCNALWSAWPGWHCLLMGMASHNTLWPQMLAGHRTSENTQASRPQIQWVKGIFTVGVHEQCWILCKAGSAALAEICGLPRSSIQVKRVFKTYFWPLLSLVSTCNIVVPFLSVCKYSHDLVLPLRLLLIYTSCFFCYP